MSHKKLLPEVIKQCTQQCSIVCCLSVGVDCWCHWAGACVQPRWHFGQKFQWLDQPSAFCMRNWPVHLLVSVSLQKGCNSLFLMAQCCFIPRFFTVHIWTAEHLGCCSTHTCTWSYWTEAQLNLETVCMSGNIWMGLIPLSVSDMQWLWWTACWIQVHKLQFYLFHCRASFPDNPWGSAGKHMFHHMFDSTMKSLWVSMKPLFLLGREFCCSRGPTWHQFSWWTLLLLHFLEIYREQAHHAGSQWHQPQCLHS